MFRLIVFDIDGTITRHVSSWQMIHEKLGMWDNLACRWQENFLKGRISYDEFCRLDAACWKGMPESKISAIFWPVRYAKNAKACLIKLKKMGFKLAALSTGLQYSANAISKDIDFDFTLTNILASRKGIMTGGVRINIRHGAKAAALKQVRKRFGLKKNEVISVGDSAGDIPLAKNSGYFIAFNSRDMALSDMAHYDCKTGDFKDIYNKILEITSKKTNNFKERPCL
ncbi:MAG: HAD-IB family phosphatase [Candidatus Omnitrophica bacterium]|nr:HAD-IB family phosphatase [Candidatus Omnitrophota bacterium]